MASSKALKKRQKNILLGVLYLIVLLGIYLRIISAFNQTHDSNLLRHFFMEFIAQMFVMLFLFRNSSFIQKSLINWLSNASLVGTIGIGLEVTISTLYLMQDLKNLNQIGLEWLVTLNLFILCFFIFYSLKSVDKKVASLLAWITIGMSLNSVIIGTQSLLTDYRNIDGFFTLLLGLQIVFFFIILQMEQNHSNLSKTNSKEVESIFLNHPARIAMIIPARNEEKLILKTLSKIPRSIDKIFVIDDGSTDQTKDIVKNYAAMTDPRVELLVHEENEGVGSAIITGYQQSYKENYDIFVVIGADAQMDMRDLPRLVQPLINNEADYVKGNRFIYGKPLSKGNAFREMPKIRIFGNFMWSILTKISSGYRTIFDSQMGYTAMHRNVFSQINWSKARKGYGYPGDWLARFHVEKIRVQDVPVRAIYLKNERQSQIKISKYLFYTSVLLLKAFSFRFYHEYLNSKKRSKLGIPSITFMSLTFLVPIGILFSFIISFIPLYAIVLGLQAIIFFVISDLVQDDLSIPTGISN